MEYIKYKGPCGMHPFICSSCLKKSTQKYIKKPHPAIIKLVLDPRWKDICKNCAKKAIGSKNKKSWDKLHEKP